MGFSIADVTSIIDAHFPQAREDVGEFVIEALPRLGSRVRLPIRERFIRPGGSVSGPTMFKLADLAVYIALIGEKGEEAVQAVTSNMNINFLARPEPADLICEARVLRLGRRLAVAEARLMSDGRAELVGHATCTYAMPSAR
jgi:uncharacterized protein (TIGR00369 family)